MSPAANTSAHAALPQRRTQFLAAVLAVLVAGGATLASSVPGDGGVPTDPGAWSAGPIEFDDPAVVKGARGGKKNTVTFPFFGDPTVRKGVGGQR